MRKFLLSLLIVSFAPAVALAANQPALPDYEKNGRLLEAQTCDKGKTQTAWYDSHDKSGKFVYRLEVATMPSGTSFYELYVDKPPRFLMKKNGVLTQMTHKDWDAALQKESPNYFNYMHSGQNDCKKVK